MRRAVKNRKQPPPDDVYGSVKVAKLINYVMERGKKDTARKIVYKVMNELKKDGDPVIILDEALDKASPSVEVRSRRVGGANYQVPREVRPERRLALGFRWIVEAAEGTKGKPMHESLLAEIRAAHKGEGVAVAKKETTHKMAEANKAFAHFAW
ncbi:MAG TPA: 30S ribosomal protein S7 [Candidatus Taylorbacteria bacterium]|uniref:Small ribosomal subunit protein uS7 n=4 Tax=Candidatus Kaiseribacteriota TaxID=1752734 RepID=A0A1F6FN52_9BACT|nr:MAG: 30S ribosomal protein S7 [Candidatus Kaiserbacteria bacterium RIFCSPLOWO2_12_FULL_50_28]HBV01446.1 30S ribosomal protein S7 [Candidatus Taylorbacteria bacterium]HCM43857.1 30S ribosomal protein S7 [Candidatus Kaiserbacteria bacterium]